MNNVELKAYAAGFLSGFSLHVSLQTEFCESLKQSEETLRALLASGSEASLAGFLQGVEGVRRSFAASAADPPAEASSARPDASPAPAVVPITSAPQPGDGVAGL